MRVLRLGCVGDDVFRWETFLKGKYPKSEIVIEGNFDQKTVDATKKYQSDVKLTPDGVVGPQTLARAMINGFNPGIEDDHDSDLNWPPKPNITQLSPAEREKLLGKFSYVSKPIKGNPEAIEITDDWVKQNITNVVIKQLIGVKGASRSGSVEIHKKIANQLVNLFQAWDDAGLKSKILTFGGTWVARYIRGSKTSLSNHAFGGAFDINMEWNVLGTQGALPGDHGSIRELITIAIEYGFYPGLYFKNRPDPMHFEVFKIL